MSNIGIVGAGIAGLHLALYLQRERIPVALYTDRSAEEVRKSSLPSTVALMGQARARDTALGTNHWMQPELDTTAVKIRVAGEHPIEFSGAPAEPFLIIDMRDYLPRLMDDFAARGGRIIYSACNAEQVAQLSADHDLMVVASGRGSLSAIFPTLPERSPYMSPQRRIFAGLFRGIELPRPFTMGFNILPGIGEVFENQFFTRGEHIAGLLVEAIPGGPIDEVTRLRYADDPDRLNQAMLALVRQHLPDTFSRTDPNRFALTGPLDTLSGAIVPAGRHGVVALPNGRFAIAVGDAHVTHDPLLGQGANAASRAAFLLGELIAAQAKHGARFDEAFCAGAEPQLWESTRAAAEWTNAFMQPPPPHAVELLLAAERKRAIADAFVTNFNHPDRQWKMLSSPPATAAFIRSFG